MRPTYMYVCTFGVPTYMHMVHVHVRVSYSLQFWLIFHSQCPCQHQQKNLYLALASSSVRTLKGCWIAPTPQFVQKLLKHCSLLIWAFCEFLHYYQGSTYSIRVCTCMYCRSGILLCLFFSVLSFRVFNFCHIGNMQKPYNSKNFPVYGIYIFIAYVHA